jgi:hypothetical protein
VSDADLTAYERTALTQFGATDWQVRRQKAIEDWLFPKLEHNGFDPQRLRTRYAPDAVLAFTGAAYTDRTSDAQGTDPDTFNLATIFATPASDALYIGGDEPFRGLSIRMLEAVSAVDATLSVALWGDVWAAATLTNNGPGGAKPFSKGGSLTWILPETLVPRPLGPIGDRLYWAKVTTTAVPTSAKCGQLAVIRRSRLCAPVTLRTLALIMREAPAQQEGPWEQKAEWYEAEAERAWNRVQSRIGAEFDTSADDVVNRAEATEQTSELVSGGGWQWERR